MLEAQYQIAAPLFITQSGSGAAKWRPSRGAGRTQPRRSDLVLEFNGAMSGEHGDGLARSHFNAKLFGPALYDAFRQVKRAFDPKNLMNPGKIVDAPAMTESLKISPQYKPWEPRTTLDFAAQGGFARAVEMS